MLPFGVVAAGFWQVGELRRTDCERANDTRRETIPALVDAIYDDLGTEFDAPPERVARAQERIAGTVDDLFPPLEC